MTPWLSDPDVDIHVGDALDVLRGLPDGSVDCCVTSPPYWGLRCYGVDGQYGLEDTPEAYVAQMVAVFAEVRRVLADHGTAWVNLGDAHANKQLQGLPWRLAFALQADGWWLRSDIIWAKPNPMPESVTDRPTKAHEYVFLLSKRPSYWFDAEAVREPHKEPWRGNGEAERNNWSAGGTAESRGSKDTVRLYNPAGRNVRSVWEIATQPYPEAHFATFPEELPRRAILAGCPVAVCSVCGKARERIVERESTNPWAERKANGAAAGSRERGYNENHGAGMSHTLGSVTATVGWSDCGHNAYRPGVVLDPFLGSGTTAHVARKHGRRCVGIELNETYAQLAARRLQQLSLLAEGGVP